MTKILEVDCPTCKKNVQWNEKSEYRPFCSERCKLIDLGEWASESYSIPVEFNEDNLIDLSKNQTHGTDRSPESQTLQ